MAFDSSTGAYSLPDILPYTHTGITEDLHFSRFQQALSGSLQIESGVLEIPVTLSQSGSTSSGSSSETSSGVSEPPAVLIQVPLSLTGGTFNMTNMSVTTASGAFQLHTGVYNPTTRTFLVSSGSL